MSTLPEAYRKLCQRCSEAGLLRTSAGVLRWDQETGMPEAAAEHRAEQLAYLTGQEHRLNTAPEVNDWLSACEDAQLAPDSVEAANVRGWRRDYDLAVKLPPELVEEISRITALAHSVWVDARKQSDFSIFQPHLEKIVGLCRRKADCWGWKACRYDALLDSYEQGATSAEVTALFDAIGPKITALVGPAAEKSRGNGALAGHYPTAGQQQFNRAVAASFGFDFSAGAIATSAHPFCTGLGPRDTRMTTRFDESDFLSSLYGVMHETGHALYEQGLDAAEWGRPAGDAASLGVHESQSRLWENHVGRTASFWRRWLPRAAEIFPHLQKISPEDAAAAALQVEPSLIRVEADEVTYDLHIILRFTLEKEIINGNIAVSDIPAAWNELFEKMIGLKVPDAARGCLQDVHWSFAGFGYFATYTLGNLRASQLMQTAENEIPELELQLTAGNYRPLLQFVRERIHKHGRCYEPEELIRRATGQRTQPDAHLDYLRRKYVG